MSLDKQHVLIVLFFVTGLICASCHAPDTYNSTRIRDWQICFNQNPDLKMIEHSRDFMPFDPTVLFRLPYEPIKDCQYVWLKSTFTVDHPEKYYGLSFGCVYLTDRVYINGHLCGSHLKEDVTELHYPRNYKLPPGVLKSGQNEILIYLGLYGREYGGISGNTRLLEKKEFQNKKNADSLIYLQIPVGIMIFLAGLIFMIFLLYMKSEKRMTAMFVIGIIGVWVMDLALMCTPIWPLTIEWRIKCLWVCSFIQAFMFLLFIESYYTCYFKKLTIVFGSVEMLFSVLALVGGDTVSPFYNARFTGAVNAVVTPVVIFFVLLKIRNMTHDRTIRFFFIFGLIPGMSISVDILNYIYGTHSPPFFHLFFIPVMLVVVIMLHRQLFIDNEKDIRILNERLMLLNTETDADEKKVVVSTQVSQKLNELLDYLDTNFALSFTREQLAEKAELSPDYLSRMFKIHTGIKLNDYINDRRVEEACRLLCETDNKIIDIAFAVGFESLATFNRAFYKKQLTSPTDFRQDCRLKKY